MDSMSSRSRSTAMTSASELNAGIDMTTAMMTASGMDVDRKRKVSMSYATDADGRPIGLPLDLFIFSDAIGMVPEGASDHPINEFSLQHPQPETRQFPKYEAAKMMGYAPLASEFHKESNRERLGPDDDGLEDEDLTAADGIARKKKMPTIKRRSIIYDNIKTTKGEFTFPYRTYRPKVQVAYQVAAGQVPQAVVVERLHRLYKRTDINLVLQTLGIEASDLIPPPNYGETNERFYQEMMFRTRTRVNGVDKKEFILHGVGEESEVEHHDHHLHAPKDNDSVSYPSTSSKTDTSENSTAEGESEEQEEEEDEEGVQHQKEAHKRGSIHPFIQAKSPFGPMLPLHCFDNTEFDIRTPEDWMSLGWDSKERRFYPLPAKAFLPLPAPSAKKTKALSETAGNHLLSSTPRLEKFHQWLLRSRFQRTVKKLGRDPSKVKYTPTEAELTLLARLGSTVPGLFRESSSSSLGSRSEATKSTSKTTTGSSNHSVQTILSNQEMVGETSTDTSSDPKNPEVIDAGGQLLPLYNIVFKKRVDRRPDEELSDDEEDGYQLRTTDDVKRSESLLADVFSDMDSLNIMASDILTKVFGDADGEETEAEDIEEDTDDKDYNSTVASNNYLHGDRPTRPSSPDIDALIDGHEKYVFDFDKMKKVHVYDWKWVDVAVFDYDVSTDRFYVRSIYAPVIHAWVDKIYLCFDGEDPNRHGQRLRDAFIRRAEMENTMRFNLYVDCLPVDKIGSTSDKIMDSIGKLSLSAPRIKYNETMLKKAKMEIDLEYKRTIARSKFEFVTERHIKMYKPWVVVPEEAKDDDPVKDWKKIQERAVPQQNLDYKVKKIQKLSVIYQKEPFEALRRINEICLEAKAKTLILIENLEPLSLDNWEKRQQENIAEVRMYLQNEWYNSILDTLREQLGKIPQSWYNLKETNYEVYLMSKLSSYLLLAKMFMEATLRAVATESLERFIDRIRDVSKNCDLKTRFAWEEDDLKTSKYPTPEGVSQIFVLELFMDNDCPKYNQLLSSFANVAGEIFSQAIQAVKELPALLPQIMPHMQFASHGFLESPEESEPDLTLMKSQLQRYIKRALLPVDSYVQLYKKYQEIWNLDIPTFIKTWEAENHTAQEVRKLVESHIQHVDQLEKEIPHEINITGFKIIVDVVREGIIKKKKALYTTILDTYAEKLKKIVLKVREDYADIEKKLNTRSDDIEEVMELKNYVEAVPSLIGHLEEITNVVIKDYEIFDKFLYAIPNDDVNAKWQAALFSRKIMKMNKDATRWLDDDYDRLLKVQQSDLGTLSDQIDSATLSVAGLVGFIELDKAADVSQEVKKIWKTVKELQDLSDLLNRRQKVFGLPPSQNDALNRLVKDIEPFKNLWFTAADWLKVQESVFGGTLEKVDIEALVRVITEGSKVIGRCIKYFSGADQIQQIASTIKYQIEDFKPLVPLIKALRNSGMRQRHWEAISDICGFPVVAKGNQNFKKLQEQGIQNHVAQISEIGELATKEYNIEIALDKMTIGITHHKVKLTVDKHSKQPIISLNDHTMQTVSEYIETTNEIEQNLYKKPFEERLVAWDKRIKNCKENMELWFENQEHWLRIEPIFKNPDVVTRLPVESKMFEKLQRIWRRLIRLARDSPDLIDLASDTTVMASIHQFSELAAKLDKALEEHQKPKHSDSDSDD